uniref:Uncharacterized protein n=1 Tax=Amphimedon queenslandica TaxID=400682 RepID=A0A1X7TKG3_AMPQE
NIKDTDDEDSDDDETPRLETFCDFNDESDADESLHLQVSQLDAGAEDQQEYQQQLDQEPMDEEAQPTRRVRLDMEKLTKEQLDLEVMEQLMACNNVIATTSTNKKTSRERKQQQSCYYHGMVKMCVKFFTFIQGIGHNSLKALKRHVKSEGCKPRIQGNKGCHPQIALADRHQKNKVVEVVCGETWHTFARENFR